MSVERHQIKSASRTDYLTERPDEEQMRVLVESINMKSGQKHA